MGMDVRLCTPHACWPDSSLFDHAKSLAKTSGARITVTETIEDGVQGCDILYTDVWLSMGEPEEKWAERITLLAPYQINSEIMSKTGNPRTCFMHCLPTFHSTETVIGKKISQEFGLDAMEVTDEVFASPASIVFYQAENRMHTITAALVKTLGHRRCVS